MGLFDGVKNDIKDALIGRGGVFERFAPKPAKTLEPVSEKLYVAGVNYYAQNIAQLAIESADWPRAEAIIAARKKDRVYKYYYQNAPVQLVPEPNNKHDRNAVAVYIAGKLVGYLSRDDNTRILDAIRRGGIVSVSAFIGGGPHMTRWADGEIVVDDNGGHNKITVDIEYYS